MRGPGSFLLLAFLMSCAWPKGSIAQEPFTLATMPRVDVHAHFGNLKQIAGMIKTSEVLQDQYKVNLEVWVNLGPFLPVRNPEPLSVEFFESVKKTFQGRVLSCLGDYDVTDGLRYSPDELIAWKNRGVIGYKIWAPVISGPVAPDEDEFTIYSQGYLGIDHPANDLTWDTMSRIGLVGASIHIAQAHPRRWKNPVHFWSTIRSWERVLEKHPEMVVVMAHMFNLFYSNEQLDYLSYVLDRYPNVHLDLGGRVGDFHSMDRQRLRDFFIRHSGRILYGTDLSSQAESGEYAEAAERYSRCFQALETDKILHGGFHGKFNGEYFGNEKTAYGTEYRGLALPLEVLEKIYFRNAMNIYPQIREVLEKRGYKFSSEPAK